MVVPSVRKQKKKGVFRKDGDFQHIGFRGGWGGGGVVTVCAATCCGACITRSLMQLRGVNASPAPSYLTPLVSHRGAITPVGVITPLVSTLLLCVAPRAMSTTTPMGTISRAITVSNMGSSLYFLHFSLVALTCAIVLFPYYVRTEALVGL